MAELFLNSVTKRFGATIAVQDLTLRVAPGEFMTLLGPSGCGKTTTLRMIAGFIRPDRGDIYFDGRPVSHIPPERRETAMVFQSYALFPHMTVAANVSFGLRMRGLPRPEIEQRVKQALTLLGIDALADRYPRQLSGGQQQRVAVARALVMQPKFLLFDEPLSNLDAKLRERMRFEIKALQRRLGITSIYVTHDQAEALVISDRVAVMNDGQLAQVGTPHEIYNNPLSTFVAGFIGLTNFLPGHVTAQRPSGYYEVATSAGPLLCRSHRAVDPGVQVKVSIRPENIMLYSDSAIVDTQNQLRGRVLQCIYMGNLSDYQVEVASDTVLRVQIQGQPLFAVGTNVQIAIVPDSCLIHLE